MILIGGCGATDSPKARFDDYLARLGHVLDEPIPATDTPALPHYPAKRALHLSVVTPRTGWVGLFELHRCGLVNLVSARNSILGRVAPPQRRLAYESRLLAGLMDCRETIEAADDPEFAARLDTLIAAKRRALPRIFWNRSIASNSLAGVFTLAGRPPGLAPERDGQATRAAIAALARAGRGLAGGRVLETHALGDIYQTLDGSDYGGGLLRAANQASAALGRARAMIESRLARRPLCFNQRPNRRARALQTVLLEIYGPRVQPYLAELVRAGRRWRDAIGQLMASQRVPIPAVFAAYRDTTLRADRGVWRQLDRAIEAHTDAWQRALRPCGLMPRAAAQRSID